MPATAPPSDGRCKAAADIAFGVLKGLGSIGFRGSKGVFRVWGFEGLGVLRILYRGSKGWGSSGLGFRVWGFEGCRVFGFRGSKGCEFKGFRV